VCTPSDVLPATSARSVGSADRKGSRAWSRSPASAALDERLQPRLDGERDIAPGASQIEPPSPSLVGVLLLGARHRSLSSVDPPVSVPGS
jgi:hypothetical protein